MAQPNKPAKTMSSRLLDMKFMQRAVASAPSNSPSTPPEPSSKRQRMSNGTYNATPSSRGSDDQSTEEAVSVERRPHSGNTEFEAADRGDTKWYLSFKQTPSTSVKSPLRIVSAGYGALDAQQPFHSSASEEGVDLDGTRGIQGRRSFGKFNRKVEKQQKPNATTSGSSSGSDSSEREENGPGDDDNGEESDDPTGAKAMIAQSRKEAGEKARAERKAKRKAAKADSTRLAEDRRKKRVKLNDLTSLSGRTSTRQDGRCYKCGKKGHISRECPESA